MARQKSSTDDDAVYADALEGFYRQCADFLVLHPFEEAIGAVRVKLLDACHILEARTKASTGPQDFLAQFYAADDDEEQDRAQQRAVIATAEETADLSADTRSEPEIEEDEAMDQAVRRSEARAVAKARGPTRESVKRMERRKKQEA
jgi:hypothetical protein